MAQAEVSSISTTLISGEVAARNYQGALHNRSVARDITYSERLRLVR